MLSWQGPPLDSSQPTPADFRWFPSRSYDSPLKLVCNQDTAKPGPKLWRKTYEYKGASLFFFFFSFFFIFGGSSKAWWQRKNEKKTAIHINVVVTMISCIIISYHREGFSDDRRRIGTILAVVNDLHRDGIASLSEWKMVLLGMLPDGGDWFPYSEWMEICGWGWIWVPFLWWVGIGG